MSRTCHVGLESIRLVRLCPVCGSDRHGRPYVVPWSRVTSPPSVSLSRTSDLTVVAVASSGGVGVDVEHIGSFADPAVSEVLLHRTERAEGPVDLAITWVRKEALLKAAGCGLGVDPSLVRLTGPGEPPVIVDWPVLASAPKPTWVHDVDLGPDVRAAVAGYRAGPEVVVRKAAEAALPC